MFQTLTRRDERESIGIGLAVVKKIVELYDGNVWIESELGKGTTFFFTLPEHMLAAEGKEISSRSEVGQP
jgi:two-component system sensor kinase FixL